MPDPRRRGFQLPGQGVALPNEPANQANVQLYNQAIPAGGTLALDSGNFFFLLNAGVTVNVQFLYTAGHMEQMAALPVGSQIKRIKTWTRALITGTPGAVIQFWHGYAFSRDDQTNFQSTIATISGAVTVVPALGSSNLPTDHADTAIGAGLTTVIPANALRKSVTVQNLQSSAGNFRIRGHGAAAGGVEVAPGTFYNIATVTSLDVVDEGAGSNMAYQEYT